MSELRASRGRLMVLASAFTAVFLLNTGLPANATTEPAPTTSREQPQQLIVETVAIAEPQRDAFEAVPYSIVTWPVPASSAISSGFGHRSAPCAGCSTNHDGVDFTPGVGTPISVIADGRVVAASSAGGLGVHAMVEHVIDGVAYTTVYAHMQSGSMTVRVGDQVLAGQQLGRVGNTGQSTGPHLHLEIWDSAGGRLDPHLWLTAFANG